MSPRLRTLLTFFGVAVIGGTTTVALWRPSEGVTARDLLDAGFAADCNVRIASCTVRLSPKGKAWLQDGGATAPTGRYAEVDLVVAVCPGANVVFAGLPGDRDEDDTPSFHIFNADECTLRTCASEPGFCQARQPRVAVHRCVKRAEETPLALCRRRSPLDGGLLDFGAENVFPAAEAVGGGCTPAACEVTDSREEP